MHAYKTKIFNYQKSYLLAEDRSLIALLLCEPVFDLMTVSTWIIGTTSSVRGSKIMRMTESSCNFAESAIMFIDLSLEVFVVWLVLSEQTMDYILVKNCL